ncbi:hypothetical protein CHARACLAT_004949 [Characodon lateralis]|uniref:Uncharacterized protein n=1 Tax=Characodon lateralis TaxID=208331 RepID=A0ABU7EHW0_9TELE|nr:hypothetical protein [Characodon lateralis]
MGGWINKEKHYALYNHGAVKKFLRPLQIYFVPNLSQSSISNLQANCNSDRDHLAKCKLQFSNNGFIKEKSNASQPYLQKVTSTLPLIPGSASIGGNYFDLGHKPMV